MLKGKNTKSGGIEFSAREYRNQLIEANRISHHKSYLLGFMTFYSALLFGMNLAFAGTELGFMNLFFMVAELFTAMGILHAMNRKGKKKGDKK